MAENPTVAGEGEAAPAVDWDARYDELTAEAARLDLELAAVDGVRGRLVAEQAAGDPAAEGKLAELHRLAAETRERRADVASALLVVRQRREAAAAAGMARRRDEMRGLLAGRLDKRLEAAAALDDLLAALDGVCRLWRALGRSASDIGHGSLGLSSDIGVLGDRQDEAALVDAVALLAPTFAEMIGLPGFVPGVVEDPPRQKLTESEPRRVANVWRRVELAAERERQEAAAPAETVTLARVA
jgi:hypothetical protein